MKHVRNYLILSIVLVVAASVCFLPFKTATGAIPHPIQTHDHAASDTSVIDGSLHPELIPDLVAFRTWLLLKSTHPERLADLGVTQSDGVQLEGLVKSFRLQYDNLVQRHNDAANAGRSPSLALLRQQIDDLVESMRHEIQKTLSAAGAALVESQVQDHKRHVRIHTPAQ